MSEEREQWRYDDAHHIRAAKGSRRTLCDQEASKLNTLPADTTVWPDANAACWTCWFTRRAVILAQGRMSDPIRERAKAYIDGAISLSGNHVSAADREAASMKVESWTRKLLKGAEAWRTG